MATLTSQLSAQSAQLATLVEQVNQLLSAYGASGLTVDGLSADLQGLDATLADHEGRLALVEGSGAPGVGRAVTLTWLYGDTVFSFELFSAAMTWLDHQPVAVTATVAGDDSVDVASTAGLVVGQSYVLVGPNNLTRSLTVAAVLSATRFTASAALDVTLGAGQATLARTSWDLSTAGQASAGAGGLYYSGALSTLQWQAAGRLVVRRDTGDGTVTVSTRLAGTSAWTVATLLDTTQRAAGSRDETWVVPGGVLEVRVQTAPGVSARPITINHLALFPAPKAGAADPVRRPVNGTPAQGTVGVGSGPTLQGGTFFSLYGLAQGGSDWRIATDAALSVLVWSGTTVGAGTSKAVPTNTLTTNKAYWWQHRYTDAEGTASLWSAPTAFSTAAVFQYIAQPANLAPATGATGVALTPTLQSSAFAVVGGADTHAKSRWRIGTSAAMTTLVYDSGEVTDLTNHTVPAGSTLSTLTTYYWQVQHKGTAIGLSEWSVPTAFTCQTVPAAPTITSPAAGATGVSLTPTITTAGFYIPGGSDAHAASRWQIATDAAFTAIVYDSGESTSLTSWSVPAAAALAGLTTYRVRAVHKGLTTGWGPWSAGVAFTTAQASQIIGIQLVATGGGAGSWQRIDKDGNPLAGAAYAFGGSYYATHPVYAAIADATIDGQSMVKIPAFYYRVSTINGKTCWWVSDKAADGFTRHPAFMAAGAEIAQFWLGKYQGGDDAGTKVKSVAGVTPLVSLTISQYQARCQARNTGGVTGFDLWSIYQLSAVQMLALIEMGGSDSQALIGQGRVSQGSAATVDAADVAQASYRGIVGLWGNVYQWLGGLKTVSGVINLWDRLGNKTWVNTGVQQATVNGYPVTMLALTGTGYDFRDVFVEATDAAIGSATWPDYQWQATSGDYYPIHGGYWSNGSFAGLWVLGVSGDATSASTGLGGRLAKV